MDGHKKDIFIQNSKLAQPNDLKFCIRMDKDKIANIE